MLVSVPAVAQEIALHGSGTVGRGIVLPNEAQIEAASGVALNVVVNGSGNGLQDLAAGRADMAMISAPIAAEAAIVNSNNPGGLDIGAMQTFEIGSSEIYFIVHPDNPVQALDEDQMLGIMTGAITNWSDVGGPNTPIVLAVEVPGNGTRAVVQSVFMDDADFATDARTMRDLNQVAAVVAQLANAVGYGNESSMASGTVRPVEGIVVAQPLALVTDGAPTPPMQAVIDAVRGL